MVSMTCPGIYQILNTKNNTRYIGSAVNLDYRLKQHKRELKRNYHCNRHLQHAFNKYGEDSFEFKPLLICSKEDLLFYEQLCIDGYGFENLYNLHPTASNSLGYKHTPEAVEKMRQRMMGENNHMYGRTGDKNPMYGKTGDKSPHYGKTGPKHSPETKKKMSEARKAYLRRIKAEGKTLIPWNKGKTTKEGKINVD